MQRFTPLLAEAARPCRHTVGDHWQVDETYVKVAGRWGYVHRAIDQPGQVIDVFLSTHRDAAAARRFFKQAITTTKVTPMEVVTDPALAYLTVLTTCSRRPGTAPSGTPTTELRPITAA